MKPLRAKTSTIGRVIIRYVDVKTALGRRWAQERRVLQSLDAFLHADGGPTADLTPASFLRWTQTLQHLTPTGRRARLRVVRNLCLYRRRTEPGCFVPDPSLFPARHQPRSPYILTDEEIARLVQATRTLERTAGSPLRPEVFRLAIVLFATTGLRRGELLRLTIGDYDRRERTLLVRASKFHKSRLVPLSPDGAREMEGYLETRRGRHLPLAPDLPLLWNRYSGGRPYTGTGFAHGFRHLLRAAGIRPRDGQMPRIHDLRHGLAVRALLRWYHQGLDVQAKLPLLAMYMGHVSIVSTHYYVAFVEPLRTVASARFAAHAGALVTVHPVPGGGPRS
jgi:integrase/recombinase XerD